MAKVQHKPLPSVEFFLSIFRYVPEEGALYWLFSPARSVPEGARAGGPTEEGYIKVRFRGKMYAVHRIIWKLEKGTEPPQIDHWDGDPANNKIGNLRQAVQADNMHNIKLSKANTSGAKGVYFSKGKYQARIRCFGESRYLGRFYTLEEAQAAYIEAAKKLHGAFAHDGYRSLTLSKQETS